MDNQELKHGSGVVVSSEKKDNRISLKIHLDARDKPYTFTFWEIRKDGGETKAYEQYKSLRPMSGDRVSVAYNERAGEPFQNQKGQTVNPIYRNIAYFDLESASPAPVAKVPTQAPQNTSTPIVERLAALEDRVTALENAKDYSEESINEKLQNIASEEELEAMGL